MNQLARRWQSRPSSLSTTSSLSRSNKIKTRITIDSAHWSEITFLWTEHISICRCIDGLTLHCNTSALFPSPCLISRTCSRSSSTKHISHVTWKYTFRAKSVISVTEHSSVCGFGQRRTSLDLTEWWEIVPTSVTATGDFGNTNWNVTFLFYQNHNLLPKPEYDLTLTLKNRPKPVIFDNFLSRIYKYRQIHKSNQNYMQQYHVQYHQVHHILPTQLSVEFLTIFHYLDIWPVLPQPTPNQDRGRKYKHDHNFEVAWHMIQRR